METVDCPDCGNEVIGEALNESHGDCPFCGTFVSPPVEVLREYEAIRRSGVTNMLEWNTVMTVAERHDLHDLVGFLVAEETTVMEQIDAISRGLGHYDPEPSIEPEVIREKNEEIEERVTEIRKGRG